jgi:hypothetical protein
MTVRSFFLLDEVRQAERLVNALFDLGFPEHDVHVIARHDVRLEVVPLTDLMQVSAVDRAAMRAVAGGGALGMLVGTGLLVVAAPQGLALGGGALLTATDEDRSAFGSWSLALLGPRLSQAEQQAFRRAVAEGQVLVMVDTESEARAVAIAERVGRPTSAVWLDAGRRAVA